MRNNTGHTNIFYTWTFFYVSVKHSREKYCTSFPNLENRAKQALFTESLWADVELFRPTPC